ncbi:MAG: TraR/DksA C4-type zinc finger protein [Candidatus Methylacidiphilales bacterium]|nr:TraR/DksA C4-type zinc finger protein [Candidatus Methylacidiphilales bacterium]
MSGKKAKASKPKSKGKPVAKGKSKPAKAISKPSTKPAKAPKKAPATTKPKGAKSAKMPQPSKSAKSAKSAKATPSAKPESKKAKSPAPSPAKKAPAKSVVAPIPAGPRFPIKGSAKRPFVLPAPGTKPASAKPRPLNPKFLEKQRKNLLELRDHILDQMQGVANDSLKSTDNAPSSAFGMHQADAGSDAYEKDFALSLLSQEQDALYEIEEALKRIEQNTYGICEMSGEAIPVERMEAIPFARYTVQCQEQLEREQKGKNRWDTAPQFMDSAENFFEEEDDSEEESQKLKE